MASKNLLLDSSNFNPESVCFVIVLQNKSSTVAVLEIEKYIYCNFKILAVYFIAVFFPIPICPSIIKGIFNAKEKSI